MPWLVAILVAAAAVTVAAVTVAALALGRRLREINDRPEGREDRVGRWLAQHHGLLIAGDRADVRGAVRQGRAVAWLWRWYRPPRAKLTRALQANAAELPPPVQAARSFPPGAAQQG